jgi:hypothetical protein
MVFGRAAALKCAETVDRGGALPDLPKGAGEQALARLDHLRVRPRASWRHAVASAAGSNGLGADMVQTAADSSKRCIPDKSLLHSSERGSRKDMRPKR